MLTRNEIEMLCVRGESVNVDFKREQYKFYDAPPHDKSELLKDIISMANSGHAGPSYILIGVSEQPDKSGKIVGICQGDVIDDAVIHQFVNKKTNRVVPFASYVVASGVEDRDVIQIIEISPCAIQRPFYLLKPFGKMSENAVYYRDGTSTAVASPEQVKAMGEDAALKKAKPVVELPEDVRIERDWSAVVVENAEYSDLDDAAVAQARKGFVEAHMGRITLDEVERWPLEVFLGKVKLAVDGKLTRAALVLLGKSEASVKLSPYVVRITWNLADGNSAYEHFGPPFLLNTSEIYRKIRNFQIKILPKNSLLPISVPKYVEKVILEPLHNCIAHQDYSKQERILVTESVDSVLMENAGTFYDGMPTDYIDGVKRPRRYRNRLLAEAMADLHMIDAMGYGIHDVYQSQKSRYLPMPDYDIGGDHVSVRVYGNIVDEAYSRLLIAHADMSMADVINLDRVQKHLPISSEASTHLRKLHYIEGRGKQVRISSHIAELTDKRAEYIQMRATDDVHLKGMIVEYLKRYHFATREDINKLLFQKMHEALNEKERLNKIGNLLSSLRVSGEIVNRGTRSRPRWELV